MFGIFLCLYLYLNNIFLFFRFNISLLLFSYFLAAASTDVTTVATAGIAAPPAIVILSL